MVLLRIRPSFTILFSKARQIKVKGIFHGTVEFQPEESSVVPVSGCSRKSGFLCQKESFFSRFHVSVAGRLGVNRNRTVKKRAEEVFVWSISPLRRAFLCGENEIAFRKETNRFPQRRNLSSAKQSPIGWKGGENCASEGFSPSGWRQFACQSCLSFCKPFLARTDAGAVSGRTALRGGRQSVAGTVLRLSSCISAGVRDGRISVRSCPAVCLRDSRRCCFDVLTKCHFGFVAVRRVSGAFATGRRPVPPKHIGDLIG